MVVPPADTNPTGSVAARASAEDMHRADIEGLRGVELQVDRVEVRLSRARARAKLFGRSGDVTQLGRFIVLERVGAGGMGVVYKAYDPQLDRRVALKVLRTDVVRQRWPALQALLVQEARAMARLSHVNVVTVFDVGTQGDEVFAAMEFIEAPTLRSWLAASERTVEAIFEVFIAAGEGLAAAHEAGVVHRDFKPDNVLVPEDGPVRVTDFGLARVLDGSAALSGMRPIDNQPTLGTLAGAGTPAYMAPEQRRGVAVDARSDQYAFCVALHEALVGERPGSPPQAIEREGVTRRRVDAIARGLEEDPDGRHPSMVELLDALQPPPRRRWRRLAVGGLVLAVGGAAVGASLMAEPQCPSPTERMVGVWDDEVSQATAAAFDATERGYASTAWPLVRTRLDRYREGWLSGRQQACRATAAGEQSEDALDLRIACFREQRESLRALTTLLREVDAAGLEHAVESTLALPDLVACDDVLALRDRQQSPPSAQALAVEALNSDLARARAQLTLARYDDAQAGARALLPKARELAYAPLLARVLHLHARLAASSANTADAVASFDEALALAGELHDTPLIAQVALDRLDAVVARPGQNDRAFALTDATEVLLAATAADAGMRGRLRLAEGRLAYRLGEYERGLEATREALALTREGSDAQQVVLADIVQQLGTLLYSQGQLDDAQEYGESALALREKLLGADHPMVAQSLANLAAISLARREVERAHQLFGRAAQIQRASLGERHPALARTLSNQCSASHEAGQYDRALVECGESVRVGEAAHGPDDPSVGPLLLNLGSVQQQAGQMAAAQATYERAQPLLERALGPEHPQFAVLLANLGRLYSADEDYGRAQHYLERAASVREAGLGADHPSTLRARQDAAETYLRRGDHVRAEAEFVAVLERLRATVGDEHVDVAAPLIGLGIIAADRGEREQAVVHLEQAMMVRATPPVRAEDLAVAQVELARVLWEDPAQQLRATELCGLARPRLPQTPDVAVLRKWAAERCP